jgi:hypothetical protein
MKIGIGGCSHSSTSYGNPWWHYMGKDMDAEIIPISSGASGNEKNIEKIKYVFETNPDLDLFIYQITEPARLVVGIDTNPIDIKKYLNDNGGEVWDPYYTFFGPGNDERLMKRYGIKTEFDEFFMNKMITSDYNMKYKFFHTLMSIQYMSDLYGKKIIFFSWFFDLQKLAVDSNHTKTIEKMNIIDSNVEKFIRDRNLPRLEDKSHLGSDSHMVIYNDFIKPRLKNLI